MKKKRHRTAPKKIELEFDKLFVEYKHLFDMTCDVCPETFESLDEARKHYAILHKNPKGYVKCCGNKLAYRCTIIKHLQRHIDPDKFK